MPTRSRTPSTLRTYRAYGTLLASDIPLPELPEAPGASPECCFRVRSACSETLAASDSGRPTWLHRSRRDDGRVWIAVGRRDHGYVIRVPRVASFAVSADGAEIHARCARGVPAHTLRHLLLDHVLPRVLDLKGALVLHAGAVAIGDSAVLLLGRSGQGKSTLTTSLARAGFDVLGDDVIVLREAADHWHAVPSYPGLRLWSDSADQLLGAAGRVGQVAHYTDKARGDARLIGARFASAPVPVVRAYVLEPIAAGAAPEIAPLSASAAFGEVVAHTFRFDPAAREALCDELETLARLATQPWFHTLRVPRSYDALDAVRAAIVRDLERGAAA